MAVAISDRYTCIRSSVLTRTLAPELIYMARRTVALNIRVTPETAAAFRDRAAELNMSHATYLTQLVTGDGQPVASSGPVSAPPVAVRTVGWSLPFTGEVETALRALAAVRRTTPESLVVALVERSLAGFGAPVR